MKSIFVSSTFRDFHRERDLLRSRIIPEVNDTAKEYGEKFQRWSQAQKCSFLLPPLYPYQFAVIYEMMAYTFFNCSADPIWGSAEQVVCYRSKDCLLHDGNGCLFLVRT